MIINVKYKKIIFLLHHEPRTLLVTEPLAVYEPLPAYKPLHIFN